MLLPSPFATFCYWCFVLDDSCIYKAIYKQLACGQLLACICPGHETILWQTPSQLGWCLLNQASVTPWGSCRLQTLSLNLEALPTHCGLASSCSITAASFPFRPAMCNDLSSRRRREKNRTHVQKNHTCLIIIEKDAYLSLPRGTSNTTWDPHSTTITATKSSKYARCSVSIRLCMARKTRTQAPSSSSLKGLLV